MEDTPALSLYEASDEDSSTSVAADRRPASKSPEKGLMTRRDKQGGRLGSGEASGQPQLQGVQHLYLKELAEEALSRPRPRKTVSNTKGQMTFRRWRNKATRCASFDSTISPSCAQATSSAISADRSASMDRSAPSTDGFSFVIPTQASSYPCDASACDARDACDASGCALGTSHLDSPVDVASGAESCNARGCVGSDPKKETSLFEDRGLIPMGQAEARGAHDSTRRQGDFMSSGLRLMPSYLKWDAQCASATNSHGKGAIIEACEREDLRASVPLGVCDKSSDAHPFVDTLEAYQKYLHSLYRKFGEKDGAVFQSALDDDVSSKTEEELTAAGFMIPMPAPTACSDLPTQRDCTAHKARSLETKSATPHPQCNEGQVLKHTGKDTSGKLETTQRRGPAVSCQSENLLKYALLNACNTKVPLEHGGGSRSPLGAPVTKIGS